MSLDPLAPAPAPPPAPAPSPSSNIVGVRRPDPPKAKKFGEPTRATFDRKRHLTTLIASAAGIAAMATPFVASSPAPTQPPPVTGVSIASVPASEVELETRVFGGHFREGCKTAMLTSAPQTFATVADLRKTLVNDATMRSSHAGIASQTQAPATRLPEEQRVVTVTAHLMAVKLEDGSEDPDADNDFHVIVGDSATATDSLLNVEASALPRAGDPGGKFQQVREELLEILTGAGIKPSASFQKPAQPITVQVTGSIYFDADHQAGQVGPAGLKPTTVWEIHPIQDIHLVSG